MKLQIMFSLFIATCAAAAKINYDEHLPLPTDLKIFLKSLLNIVNYANGHISDMEINFIFGIFLTKVNLMASLREEFVVPLPRHEAATFEEILRGCDSLLDLFNQKKSEDWAEERENGKLSFFFWNVTAWTSVLPKYTIDHSPDQKGPRDVQTDRKKWEYYSKMVTDYENGVPDPTLFDQCMMVIDQNPQVPVSTQYRCQLTDVCYNTVRQGSEFGYALTHRLIMILHASLDRHCYITSPAEDSAMAQQFCTSAYEEAVYISMHQFRLRDIFMEQISLCTLLGRAEFLQRPWLYRIISWQQETGCFQENFKYQDFDKMPREEPQERKMDMNFLVTEDEDCNGHVTAVASAALSAAVRFILEKYYT